MLSKNQKLLKKRAQKDLGKEEIIKKEIIVFKRGRQREYSKKNRVRRKEYIQRLEEKVNELELKVEELNDELIKIKYFTPINS